MILSVQKRIRGSWLNNQDKNLSTRPFTWITSLKTDVRDPNRFITGLKDEAEEAEYEQLLREPKGSFAPKSPYWENYVIDINESTVFNTDIPEDRLKLKILSTLDIFAEDEALLETKKVDAVFVLVNQENRDKKVLEKYSAEEEAYAILRDSSPEELKMILTISGINTYDMSETSVKANYLRIVKSGSTGVENLIKIAKNKEALNVRYLIKEALFYNIIFTDGMAYRYNQIMLGATEKDTVKYLSSKGEVNTRTYLEIKEQIAAKKKLNTIDIEA
jgi:hypothetical protein